MAYDKAMGEVAVYPARHDRSVHPMHQLELKLLHYSHPSSALLRGKTGVNILLPILYHTRHKTGLGDIGTLRL